MSFAYYAVISTIICWRWGNWRAWKDYYPTIIFMIMGNLAYMVLTQQKPLWKSGSFLALYPFLDISTIVVLYTSTVILLFTFYSRFDSNLKRVGYIALWVAIYSAMELVSYITGHFEYYNGWNFFYSVIFNVAMFPLLLLHKSRQLLALSISVLLAYALMFLFDIPFKI